ncbi:unnamed protein product, partial [Phaeothamnion confervicola]
TRSDGKDRPKLCGYGPSAFQMRPAYGNWGPGTLTVTDAAASCFGHGAAGAAEAASGAAEGIGRVCCDPSHSRLQFSASESVLDSSAAAHPSAPGASGSYQIGRYGDACFRLFDAAAAPLQRSDTAMSERGGSDDEAEYLGWSGDATAAAAGLWRPGQCRTSLSRQEVTKASAADAAGQHSDGGITRELSFSRSVAALAHGHNGEDCGGCGGGGGFETQAAAGAEGSKDSKKLRSVLERVQQSARYAGGGSATGTVWPAGDGRFGSSSDAATDTGIAIPDGLVLNLDDGVLLPPSRGRFRGGRSVSDAVNGDAANADETSGEADSGGEESSGGGGRGRGGGSLRSERRMLASHYVASPFGKPTTTHQAYRVVLRCATSHRRRPPPPPPPPLPRGSPDTSAIIANRWRPLHRKGGAASKGGLHSSGSEAGMAATESMLGLYDAAGRPASPLRAIPGSVQDGGEGVDDGGAGWRKCHSASGVANRHKAGQQLSRAMTSSTQRKSWRQHPRRNLPEGGETEYDSAGECRRAEADFDLDEAETDEGSGRGRDPPRTATTADGSPPGSTAGADGGEATAGAAAARSMSTGSGAARAARVASTGPRTGAGGPKALGSFKAKAAAGAVAATAWNMFRRGPSGAGLESPPTSTAQQKRAEQRALIESMVAEQEAKKRRGSFEIRRLIEEQQVAAARQQEEAKAAAAAAAAVVAARMEREREARRLAMAAKSREAEQRAMQLAE